MKRHQLALLGNPAHHSLSPMIHQHFAQQCDLSLHYQTVELPLTLSVTALRAWCDQFFAQGGQGLNVTAPFKLLAAQAADCLTERATQAQAVNTLYCIDNQLIGDNTDGVGLVQAMRAQNMPLSQAHWLILGAGGAAAGIIPYLLAERALLTISNRTKCKAEALIQRFATDGQIQLFDDRAGRTFTGILNTCGPVYQDMPANSQIAYDLSYSKSGITPFLCVAQAAGAEQCHDGLAMLVWQAAFAFERWFNILPDAHKTTSFITNDLQRSLKIR